MFFKMPMESFPLPTLFSHLLLFRWRLIRRLSFEILCGQARQTPCFPLASSHVMRQAVLACDPGPCMCCFFMPEPSPFSPGSLAASLASLDLSQHRSSLLLSLESYLQVVGAWINACLLPRTVKEHALCWWTTSAQHNACPTTGARVFIESVSPGGQDVSLHC